MKLLSQWFDYNERVIAEVFYDQGLFIVKSDHSEKVCFNNEQAAEDFAEYIYFKVTKEREE